MEGTAPSKPADTMCRRVEGKPAQIRSRAGVVDRLGIENIDITQSYLADVPRVALRWAGVNILMALTSVVGLVGALAGAVHVGALLRFAIVCVGVLAGVLNIVVGALARAVITFMYKYPGTAGVCLPLLVSYLPYVHAVTCIHCKDRFDPPGHAPDHCPTLTVVAANVAAAAAGTYALINLDKILPTYVLRLFPRAAIRALSTLRNTPNPGAGYSFTNGDGSAKSLEAVIRDYQSGLFTKDEGILHYGPMLASTGDGADAKRALAKAALTVFDKSSVPTPVDTVGVYEGPYLYLLNRVSEYAAQARGEGTYGWMHVGVDNSEAGSSASHSSSWLKAKAFHPTAFHQFFHMLNLWVMLLHATGMDNALSTTTFLEEVVYDSMDEDAMDWHMVYCLLIVYLTSVEKDAGVTLANVCAKGGRDDKKVKAQRLHDKIYGDLFSARGQSVRDPGNSSTNHNNTAKALQWCATSKVYFNTKSKIPCRYYNEGTPHPDTNLAADGSCNFLHACNALVTNADGKREKCLGKHPAGKGGKDCTNPKRVAGA